MKAICTKFMGPTNHQGARIKASDMDGNTITIAYPHDGGADVRHRAAAIALCQKMGWQGRMIEGSTKTGSVFVFVSSGDLTSEIFDIPEPQTAGNGN